MLLEVMSLGPLVQHMDVRVGERVISVWISFPLASFGGVLDSVWIEVFLKPVHY
jgi:hypothetical protein